MSGARAVFLDRDGVLVLDVGHLTDAARIGILPGAAAGMAALRRAGFALVVATNQSAVGRGLLTAAGLEALNARIAKRLLAAHPEARWDALYACIHLPEALCACRKPRPGMLLRAAGELGLDLARSWMVGDSARDVEAGRAAGCRTAVLPGPDGGFAPGADLEAPTLAAAAEALTALPERC